jgi:phosphoribosylglycinamide formyltransferase-1
MKRISVFVSGNGTNLQRIAEYFKDNKDVEIVNVVCNNPQAYAIERAHRLGIPVRMITKAEFNSPEFVQEMAALKLDLIVLAGFLWKIPAGLIQAYPRQIVNIHPALLPKYGGKGMWGHHVHEAVKAAGETETGMTVHYVTPVCDSGEIIAQYRCSLSPDDTADDIAEKEHQLEMKYFPHVVEEVLKKLC